MLRERGYSLDSVPRDGELVRLKTVVSDNHRDENVDAMAKLCRAIAEAAAAQAVGARLAAVDLITSDPQAPLTRPGGAIIEVNTTPGFLLPLHETARRSPRGQAHPGTAHRKRPMTCPLSPCPS